MGSLFGRGRVSPSTNDVETGRREFVRASEGEKERKKERRRGEGGEGEGADVETIARDRK